MILSASLPANPFGDSAWLYRPPRLTVRALAARVEHLAQLEPGAILSERRTRAVAWPRQALMMALRDIRGLSYPEIGRKLGGRDHTTIMYGAAQARDRRAADPQFAALCGAICARVRG